MRLTYRDENGVPRWISGLLDIEHDDIGKFLRMTIADYEDELEGKQLEKDRIPGRCENCDLWNTWDEIGRKSQGYYRCSCAWWSGETHTEYTAPDDFCSGFVPREEDNP